MYCTIQKNLINYFQLATLSVFVSNLHLSLISTTFVLKVSIIYFIALVDRADANAKHETFSHIVINIFHYHERIFMRKMFRQLRHKGGTEPA